MPRISPPLEIEEISGDRFPDLRSVQELALSPLSGNLADTLRGLLAAGILTLEDGHIIITSSKNGDLEHGC